VWRSGTGISSFRELQRRKGGGGRDLKEIYRNEIRNG